MEHILTHYRRVLGEDHPVTLRLAHNLAARLRGRGEHEQARELDEDTLSRAATDAKIADVHGTPLIVDGQTLFPLYHPAAAMYNQSLRATLFDDARALAVLLSER